MTEDKKEKILLLMFRLFRLGQIPAMVTALLLSAGQLDLPFFWAYMILFSASGIVAKLIIPPDLQRERLLPGPGEKDEFTRWALPPFILAHWLIAGLDTGRFHFSDSIPTLIRVLGLTGQIASHVLATWSMKTNPFFSSAVRIQHECGQILVTSGPYKLVRHPGYTAAITLFLFSGLVLGSWYAMAPIGICILFIIRRTILEDRFLYNQLDDYPEYSQKVRFCLIPGIW